MSDEAPRRLDPDRAARVAAERAGRRPPPPVVDTRRYQRMIGFFGLALVIVISVAFLLTSHGVGTAGIPAGQKLHMFAAPLAASSLNGDANLRPPCTESQHDRRALNLCLLLKRGPVVLGFFTTGSGATCERLVDAFQRLAPRFPQVQFAAVAVRSTHASTRAVVRSHHWTIPVAYDLDGAVGAVYGVEVCPIAELAGSDGVVRRRLIGWPGSRSLARAVATLARQAG